MTRYEVTATVPGVGCRKHVIAAADPGEAWDRFQRSYSERECIREDIRRVGAGSYRSPALSSPEPAATTLDAIRETIPAILAECAEAHGVTPEDIMGGSMANRTGFARMDAYRMTRERNPLATFAQIAQVFGRVRSTVQEGVKRSKAAQRTGWEA